MKLLLAMDFSLHSQRVLNEVARRPWPSGSSICVVNVLDWPSLESTAAVVDATRRAAVDLLESAADRLRPVGLTVSTEILEKNPRKAIAQYAKEWGADLILMGSQGSSTLKRLLLGSVAQTTLRRASCSVEIVRAAAASPSAGAQPMKILLGTDGSDGSTAAVRTVASRPWPAASEVRVISAIPIVVLTGDIASAFSPMMISETLVGELEEQAKERAKDAVAKAREILQEAGIKLAEAESTPLGDAREVLVGQAKSWGANLVVLGSHGYHAIDRLVLGSVAEYVALHAPCSVEVVH